MTKTYKIIGIVATFLIVTAIPLSLLKKKKSSPEMEQVSAFTGGKSCVECHQKEYKLWKGSDHELAMAHASDSIVLGDFNDATFTYNGINTKFYKRDRKFYVFTEGIGGKMAEFEISYTFGIRPLQQYLIAFENGKYQCLPIAWNSRDKKWFHMASMVYTKEDLKPDNWLYWTNQSQNWNSMCAECHSTNLNKNFDLNTKSYQTTFTDINVNCEACHGPGSVHLEWAKLPELDREKVENAGLVLKTGNVTARQYVESCAPCHARRSSMDDNRHNTNEFLNYAIPQMPIPPNYHADGQFLNEDYEYASFTQSKMFMKDVRCGDCHDPHSLKRKFEGNALCSQCHKPEDYDTFNHHHHKSKGQEGKSFINSKGETMEVGTGTLCRECHMPGAYFMGIDHRFDHSFRVPRPDLSIQLGTPNACTNCHDDKTNGWALTYVNKWYGEKKKSHYGTIFNDANQYKPGTDTLLIRLINSNLYPEIVKATAIGHLPNFPTEASIKTVEQSLNNFDPLIRYAAIYNYNPNDSNLLFNNLLPLLSDPIKAIRMEAANRLFGFDKNRFNETQYTAFQMALTEYKKALEYAADFPAGRYNLGNFYMKNRDVTNAIINYRESIALDYLIYPAKSNLAMIYYQQGKLNEAETLFQEMVNTNPEVIDGYYYLSLLYGEQNKYPEAIDMLEKAKTKQDATIRVYYNLGLMYKQIGKNEKCEATFAEGLKQDPKNFDLLYAMFSHYLSLQEIQKAAPYIIALKTYYPNDLNVQNWAAGYEKMVN
jgi:tetratricopeptide (TPR) repeat protein